MEDLNHVHRGRMLTAAARGDYDHYPRDGAAAPLPSVVPPAADVDPLLAQVEAMDLRQWETACIQAARVKTDDVPTVLGGLQRYVQRETRNPDATTHALGWLTRTKVLAAIRDGAFDFEAGTINQVAQATAAATA
jgi:hypothetical protein